MKKEEILNLLEEENFQEEQNLLQAQNLRIDKKKPINIGRLSGDIRVIDENQGK